jgi:hypothetical protein
VVGHATIQTTEAYLDKLSLDELSDAVASLRFGARADEGD